MKELILKAILKDLPYSARPQPTAGKKSAVFVLLDFKNARNLKEIRVLLTQRSEHVETHKGHAAFPGGICEPDELVAPNGQIETAIRELGEEVGIDRGSVEVLGALPELCTLSGFIIYPVVGVTTHEYSDSHLKPQVSEVEAVFWVSLEELSSVKKMESYILVHDVKVMLPVFALNQCKVWGATAIILENLIQRLE